MERQEKLIDASVIVKWFSKEENSDKALRLKEGHISQELRLIIPELSLIEVINALRYKEKDESKLKDANKTLQDIQLGIKSITKDLINKAIENALKYDITIYDSIYVSLAQMYGCPFVTADSTLYSIPNVISLENS